MSARSILVRAHFSASKGIMTVTTLLRRLIPVRKPRTLASLDAYAHWAASYPPHAHNALMQAEESAMIAMLPPLAGRTVLDLACGTGRYALIAQQHGAEQVYGLDNSAEMLQRHPLQHTTAQASTGRLPLSNASVDVILCGLALGHLPRLAESLNEIGRILRRDGFALVSDVHPFLFLNGAQRTFTASDGRAYAVEHYPHLYSAYFEAGRAAHLRITELREPMLPGGKIPVAVVYRFEPV